MLFYLKHPNFIKPEKIRTENTNKRNTVIADIVNIYFWQIEFEIRAFDWEKITITV